MVLLSLEQYSALTDSVELKLDEADKAAQLTNERFIGEEVFSRIKKRTNG